MQPLFVLCAGWVRHTSEYEVGTCSVLAFRFFAPCCPIASVSTLWLGTPSKTAYTRRGGARTNAGGKGWQAASPRNRKLSLLIETRLKRPLSEALAELAGRLPVGG